MYEYDPILPDSVRSSKCLPFDLKIHDVFDVIIDRIGKLREKADQPSTCHSLAGGSLLVRCGPSFGASERIRAFVRLWTSDQSQWGSSVLHRFVTQIGSICRVTRRDCLLAKVGQYFPMTFHNKSSHSVGTRQKSPRIRVSLRDDCLKKCLLSATPDRGPHPLRPLGMALEVGLQSS